MQPLSGGAGRGLVLDYGGVLTHPVEGSFRAFELAHGIDPGASIELLVAVSRSTGAGLIGSLERGEVTVERFEAELARLLAGAGYEPPDRSLVEGLFDGMRPAGPLWGVARAARGAGVRTALLSNSWGTDGYPRQRLSRHFDVQVISGEVGLRKPDPEIYLMTCRRLGVGPEACVFVDDLEHNIEVARGLGMRAVHHRGDEDEVVAAVVCELDLDPEVVADEVTRDAGRPAR